MCHRHCLLPVTDGCLLKGFEDCSVITLDPCHFLSPGDVEKKKAKDKEAGDYLEDADVETKKAKKDNSST